MLIPASPSKIEPLYRRAGIMALEAAMLDMPEDQVEIETKHHFAPGIYAREIFIPAGTALVGKIHKTQHINVVAQGRITVVTEEGLRDIEAPFVFVAPPGTKRAGYAHEDTVWITFHPSNETDLDKLERELIATSFEEFEALAGREGQACLGSA